MSSLIGTAALAFVDLRGFLFGKVWYPTQIAAGTIRTIGYKDCSVAKDMVTHEPQRLPETI